MALVGQFAIAMVLQLLMCSGLAVLQRQASAQAPDSPWLSMLPFFKRAQDTLNISVEQHVTIDYMQQLYSQQPNTELVHCSVMWHGVLVTYLQVYKGNTQGFCKNLNAIGEGAPISTRASGFLDARAAAREVVTFSFVRDPVEHLISGYSEWEWRRRVDPEHNLSPTQRLEEKARWEGHSEKELATGFIHDMLACKGQTMSDLDAAHAAPLTAFVFSGQQRLELSKLDFIGRLDNVDADWEALGRIVRARAARAAESIAAVADVTVAAIPEWPDFYSVEAPPSEWPDYSNGRFHDGTDKDSGFSPRAALEDVLSREPDLALATCLLLLPDFACFDYSMPQALGGGACTSIAHDREGRFKDKRLCALSL